MNVGWLMVAVIYLSVLALHMILPARTVSGYCCDNKTFLPLQYRLNGVFVLLISIAVYTLLLSRDWQQKLYLNYSGAVVCANIFGLTASLFFFIRGGKEKYARCVTVDQRNNRDNIPLARATPNFLVVFFLGREWNPRFYGVDVKMFLYVVGAVGLQCNLLSALSYQIDSWNGQISNAMLVYISCFSWFIFEYMCGEEVHLYTYDLFAEKIGFKLTWGCLVFYPFFYPIGSFSIASAHLGNDISSTFALSVAALYFLGWMITRGANMQKFFFRTQPQHKTFLFGLIRQEVVPGTSILCSGYWGLARHLNYFGEILQAVALALPGCMVGNSAVERFLPWLYPIYYCLLFIPRQIDDDAVCKVKYGTKWDEYCKRVPYRICPGVW